LACLVVACCVFLAGCENANEAAARPTTVSASPPTLATTDADPSHVEGPVSITWDELNIPIDPDARFEPWMLTTGIKSLEGETVHISGFMYPGVFQKENIKEFVLIKHLGCQFGATGHPQHVMVVELQDKLRTSFTSQPIDVEGTFRIRPWLGPDGETWAIYHLEGTKVTPSAQSATTEQSS
jgi:hypothetical protein